MTEVSPQQLWTAALGQLQLQVARPTFDTFLRETEALALRDGCLIVGTRNPFVAEFLSQRLYGLIQTTVERLAQRPLDVRFQVIGPPQVSANGNGAVEDPANGVSNGHPPPQVPVPGALHANYTFPSFIVGRNNELAHAAARAAADFPGKKYNPVFIHSPVGLGKTHLLQAVAHRLQDQGHRATYRTSEQFTNAFIRAIREGQMPAFQALFCATDALLIDDIQFLEGKEQTQEGFFHLFNTLYQAGRQVVISGDRPPKALTLLEERLRSRFQAGLTADMQPPPLETRLAILRAKAAGLGVGIPSSVLEIIALGPSPSVRDLEGHLNRVAAHAELTGEPITPDLAQRALGGLISARAPSPPSPATILETVATHFGLPTTALTGPRRDRTATLARRITMYLLWSEYHHPPSAIARLLGGRHPSTVHQAAASVKGQAEKEAPFRETLSTLLGKCSSLAPAKE